MAFVERSTSCHCDVGILFAMGGTTYMGTAPSGGVWTAQDFRPCRTHSPEDQGA